MKGKHIILVILVNFLPLSVSTLKAQEGDKVDALIQGAIEVAGGMDTWQQHGNLVVHERQTRNEEEGIVEVSLVHYMNTSGKGYRIELSRSGRNYVYGWDGREFWATADGKPGDHDLVSEAKRVISDAYFRFSLPFILDDAAQHPEYSGKDSIGGSETEAIKITYAQGPADRYFSPPDEDHGHKAADTETEHGSGSGGHHHGSGEVYFFHFDQQGRVAGVYFSHHGDGTYETLLLEDFRMIDGISREHKRVLLRPDGETHYESVFSRIEFLKDIDTGIYARP